MTTANTIHSSRAEGAVPALVGQGYRVNSDEWWTFDTDKYDFFHEQCCDCGLNHKTHVRLEGTKIHFRHERRDRPPTPDEIDNSDLPNAACQVAVKPYPEPAGSELWTVFHADGDEAGLNSRKFATEAEARAKCVEWNRTYPGHVVIAPNTRPHADTRSADSVQEDIGPGGVK